MASAKVDNRASFGSKRSRNDVSRNDGDWTCPQCGNLNFAFRTVCNRGKCGAARPITTPRIGYSPVPSPFNHTPFYLGGVGASPPLPLGMPNSYGPPFSPSAMRYDYGGVPGSATGHYGLLSAFPPGPFGGMGYGPGFGYGGSPLPMPGPWSVGAISDNSASRKRRGGPDGLSEGDWVCPKCDNVNFAFRTTCNMKKCGTPRPSSGTNHSVSGIPEGSWRCSRCENLNYPFRMVCNRKGCGNEKPAPGK
ncbi:PREDICTED: ranBP2-type zinc finger protein At1g67325-like isoform X2 [Nelumbo nucifera]|uniref:RanBP2-type zinc finger protein At1g67325-like isoform X2 n=1 Tax=Nelumbo nucifera TaxID=4432 RepID=A0A1U8B3L7_NELNU|nr:PREDICTED: ranBP2-type zinc finger protein At1g67325-like isoform X2 [Nelumbo nucifera]